MPDEQFWEYWVEDFEENMNIEPRLNELGKLRWELVAVVNLSTQNDTHILHCVLKRRRDEPDHQPPY